MNALKKMRNRYHLSIEFVSRKSGVPKETLVKLENGSINGIDYSKQIKKIIKFYDVSYEDLHDNILPNLSLIARHKGEISSHDKKEISKIYKLQGIIR